MNLYLSFGEVCPSRDYPVFLTRPRSSHHAPHIPSIVPIPLVLPSSAVYGMFFQHSCIQDIPPSRTLPLIHFLQRINHRMLFSLPLDGAPHTFRKFLEQKGQFHPHPNLPGRDACSCLVIPTSLHFVFSGWTASSLFFSLPHFIFPLSVLSTSKFHFQKRKNGVHMIHQSLTFYSPRDVLTSVYLDVFPKGFVCWLHSFFHSVARLFSWTIHHASQYLEFVFKREFVTIFWCKQNHLLLFFRSVCARPPQACRLGLQIHLSVSSMRFFSICSRCFLEWDTVQELLAHMKIQIWCTSPSASMSTRTPFLCFIHSSSTLANIWVATCCHKRGASTLPGRIFWDETRLTTGQLHNSQQVAEITQHILHGWNTRCAVAQKGLSKSTGCCAR